MTTLDGVERTPRRRDGAGLRRERALRDRRDHGRPGLRGLRRDDQRAARGRQLERDQHPAHLAPARPALGGLLALREAAAPGALHAGAADRLAADGRALRGEAACRGRSTSPPRSRLRTGSRLRGARVEGLLGMAIAQADQVAYLERLGFGVEADGEDLRSTVPPDRHYDVTREVDLIEEVGRVHGLDEHLPSTLPGAAGPGRRPDPRAAPAPPGRGRDARPRLRRDRRLELHRPRRGRAAADPRRGPARRRGRDLQPALRGPVGDADDAARLAARRRPRATSPAAPSASPSSSPAASTSSLADGRQGELTPLVALADFPGERPAPFHEPHRLGALAVGPLVAGSWRGGGEAGRLLRAQGRARGARRPARRRRSPSSRAASRSCTRAAPRAVLVGGEPAGWIGEVHPLVCREWDLEAAVAFEVDLARAGRAPPRPARRSTRT